MPQIRLHHFQKERGFTLVEVLIAMLVFSFLMSATLAVFTTSINAKNRMASKSKDLESIARMRALLKTDFANTVVRPVRDVNGIVEPIQFYVGMDNVLGPGLIGLTRTGWQNPGGLEKRSALQKIVYRVENGKFIRDVFLRAVPANDVAKPQILLNHIKEVKGRVFVNGDWVDNWITGQSPMGQKTLPKIISIDISRNDGTNITQLFFVGADQ